MTTADEEEQSQKPRRAMVFRLPWRRRKMVVVRLGGGSRKRRQKSGGRRILTVIFRRMRLRWLVAKYRAALKRLKEFHGALERDIIDSNTSVEALRARLAAESFFGLPFLPVTAVHPCSRARQ